MTAPLTIIGDTLLDRDVGGEVFRLAPDAPVPVVDESFARSRPGGAGLAALLAARSGRETTLVTALGNDEAGAEVAGLLEDAGVSLVDIGTSASTPEKIRIHGQGRPLVRLDRGGNVDGVLGTPGRDALAACASAGALLVSDYGRGLAADAGLRRLVVRNSRRVPVVWDPHPRGGPPVPRCRLTTPNLAEAKAFAARLDPACGDSPVHLGRSLFERWSVGAVAITLGADGALLIDGGAHPLRVPAPALPAAVDTCGAGDMFAVTVTGLLADGLLPSDSVAEAVRAAARFVEQGGAGALAPAGPGLTKTAPSTATQLAAEVRAAGGTVVATGGCFDVLHRGHVEMLEAAARLGDCLIVCLNGDGSVRRLKGPRRPINPCADRVAVLGALASVDAVEVFDDSTPHTVLARLRPHLWVKGGDYRADRLPEAPLVESWGGEVVILPYLRGRSTTDIVARAR